MHETQPPTSTQHHTTTAKYHKTVKKGAFYPHIRDSWHRCHGQEIREQPPIHPQAPWPGQVHPQQTCLEQFIPGLSSPPGLLTCPCSALTTVLDWSTWLQQPQLFMVIAELIIK